MGYSYDATATAMDSTTTTTTTQEKEDKIVCFIHFHKAGGTSIVNAFKQQQHYFKFWEPNRNGNPWRYNNGIDDKAGMSMIELWNFDSSQFETWLMEAKSRNIKFVAMEWNFFTRL